jgi:hypothetical protein
VRSWGRLLGEADMVAQSSSNVRVPFV